MKAILAVTAVLATLSTAAEASLIANGGFEALPTGSILSGRNWSVYTSLPGWQTARVEVQQGTIVAPLEGLRYIELDTSGFSSNSSILQDFATTIGTEYRISFGYAPRPEVSSDSNTIAVSFGATGSPAAVTTLLNGLSSSNIGTRVGPWRLFQFVYTATSTSSFLRFAAQGRQDTLGGFIDAVSVVALRGTVDGNPAAVPVPAAAWLFASALIGMAGIARRKS
jgi:hypothetical protein